MKKIIICALLISALSCSLVGCNNNDGLRDADKNIEVVPYEESRYVKSSINDKVPADLRFSSHDGSSEETSEETEVVDSKVEESKQIENSTVSDTSNFEESSKSEDYAVSKTDIAKEEWGTFYLTGYSDSELLNVEMKITSVKYAAYGELSGYNTLNSKVGRYNDNRSDKYKEVTGCSTFVVDVTSSINNDGVEINGIPVPSEIVLCNKSDKSVLVKDSFVFNNEFSEPLKKGSQLNGYFIFSVPTGKEKEVVLRVKSDMSLTSGNFEYVYFDLF